MLTQYARSAFRGILWSVAALYLAFVIASILATYHSLDLSALDLVLWVLGVPPILTLRIYWVAIAVGTVLGLVVPAIAAQIESPLTRHCSLIALGSIVGIVAFHGVRLAVDWELPPPHLASWISRPSLLFGLYTYAWLIFLSSRLRKGPGQLARGNDTDPSP